jgi:hypothetical protein
MPSFIKELDIKLDAFAAEGSNLQFRLFLSSDPADGILIVLLKRSIKIKMSFLKDLNQK